MLVELFSKRQAKLIAPKNEIYLYDKVPKTLRHKICYILDDALGDEDTYGGSNQYQSWGNEKVKQCYEFIWDTFRREHGFPKEKPYNYREALQEAFLQCEDMHALDIIELCFRVIDKATRKYDYKEDSKATETADNAIEELNVRFREEKIGYRFESGELIKIDSEFTHQEVIKPALRLLTNSRFKGANDEFLKAHEDFRKGDNRDSVLKACQAFESVMKVICKSNGWEYDENAPAKKLISVLTEKGLIKSYSTDSYNALVKLLENAIPTPRNKEAGHGQGETIKSVPSYLASHILNITASTIVYLVEAEKHLK